MGSFLERGGGSDWELREDARDIRSAYPTTVELLSAHINEGAGVPAPHSRILAALRQRFPEAMQLIEDEETRSATKG